MSPNASSIPADFEWTAGIQFVSSDFDTYRISVELADYDVVLDQIATTDIVK